MLRSALSRCTVRLQKRNPRGIGLAVRHRIPENLTYPKSSNKINKPRYKIHEKLNVVN